MLRSRSRSVTTKQPLMADHNSVPSPKPNQTTTVSSFFGSPRLFNGFFSKGVTNFETTMSPTSILDTQKVSNFGNPFGYYDPNMAKSPRSPTEKKNFIEGKGIGLALVDSLNDEKSVDNFNFTKTNRRIHFGSRLKIHVPTTLPQLVISPTLAPKSPADYRIKTRNSEFSGDSSPLSELNYGVAAKDSPNMCTGVLSWSEMELSEDYTCVITHGPNPKTTRIYDNCIVESCCGGAALPDFKKEFNLSSPSQSYLSFCHKCKKNIGQGKDIYMYRGEKAFCSDECRCEEILLDGMKNSEF